METTTMTMRKNTSASLLTSTVCSLSGISSPTAAHHHAPRSLLSTSRPTTLFSHRLLSQVAPSFAADQGDVVVMVPAPEDTQQHVDQDTYGGSQAQMCGPSRRRKEEEMMSEIGSSVGAHSDTSDDDDDVEGEGEKRKGKKTKSIKKVRFVLPGEVV
jgi:hypothetical protein